MYVRVHVRAHVNASVRGRIHVEVRELPQVWSSLFLFTCVVQASWPLGSRESPISVSHLTREHWNHGQHFCTCPQVARVGIQVLTLETFLQP